MFPCSGEEMVRFSLKVVTSVSELCRAGTLPIAPTGNTTAAAVMAAATTRVGKIDLTSRDVITFCRAPQQKHKEQVHCDERTEHDEMKARRSPLEQFGKRCRNGHHVNPWRQLAK